MQRVKQLADGGYIGQAFHGDFRWLAQGARSGEYRWRYDGDRANGILGDLGSHMIHLALWLMGDVASVSAHLGYYTERLGPEDQAIKPANDSAMVTLEFTSGAQAFVQVSAVALAPTTEFNIQFSGTVYGRDGTLEAHVGFPPDDMQMQMRLRGRQDSDEDNKAIDDLTPMNFIDFFKQQSVGPRQFVDCILEDKPISPGLYEGYKVQQIIDAALESHESGRRVVIEP